MIGGGAATGLFATKGTAAFLKFVIVKGTTEAAAITVADVLLNIAIGFIIQRISLILFPLPEPPSQEIESKIDTSSYIFSSLDNTATQGFAIPLVYGELRVGSNIVSTSVISEDLG